MSSKIYGYVRVSTKEQNLARQISALIEFGVLEENIFVDKQSGKDFDRPGYKDLLKNLSMGDLFVVKSLDRLGRNYDEILEHWRLITKTIKADIVVLNMPLLDTRTREKNLLGMFISDLVLQILSYVAQSERELTRQRQAEGIAIARAKGVKFGRQSKTLPSEFTNVCKECESGELSIRRAAEKLNMAKTTFYRYYKQNQVKIENNYSKKLS